MHFVTEQTKFLAALQKVLAVTERRNTVPILGNVYLEVADDVLYLAGTDLEISLRTFVPLLKAKPGKVTIPVRSLTEIVRELPNMPIHCETTDTHWLHLRCGRTKFTIAGRPGEDFPTLPEISEEELKPIFDKSLLKMIRLTKFCTSEETVLLLNGASLYIKKQSAEMVGSDIHRLAFVESALFQEPQQQEYRMIIPNKGLIELRRHLERHEINPQATIKPGYFFLKTAETLLSIRMLEGEYPDYQNAIPKNFEVCLTIPRLELMAAIKRMNLLQTEKFGGVKLALSENNLIVSSVNFELGEGFEQLEVSYEHEPYEVTFSAKYVLVYLSELESASVRLYLKGPNKASLFEPLEPLEGMTSKYLIMPVALR